MRNLLLITADQFRGDCLGVAGHPVVKTPHLDALCAEGVRFTQHYAGAVPCSPARACLYTGLYQMNNRVCANGSPLDNRHDTLPRAMKRGGYNPVLFGYTDQAIDPTMVDKNDPALRSYEGVLPGFTARVLMSDHPSPWLSWLEGRGHRANLDYPHIEYPAGGAVDPPVQIAPEYSADESQTAFLTGEFIRWLGEQRGALPEYSPGWFSHVSFLRPHPPFSVPEPYNSMYSPNDIPEFCGYADWKLTSKQHPFLKYKFDTMKKENFIPGIDGLVNEWTDHDLRVIAAIYYGMISEVDCQIGKIVKALKAQGQWENTVIVFTSDHGEMMGDHRMLGKFGFHDGSYHLPLIVCSPEHADAHGSTISQFTEAVDIFPTVLDLLEQKLPLQLDGKSLLNAVKGESLEGWRASAQWEYDFRDVAGLEAEKVFGLPSQLCNLSVIRDNQFKYVHFAGLAPLLYDLASDPNEQHNVAEHESYQSVRLYLAEKLLRWRAEHLDQSLALSTLTSDGLVSL